MKIKHKSPKYSKRDRGNLHTVWGMNNSLALLNSENYMISTVTIMKDSIAWKSEKIQSFLKKKSFNANLLQKSEFIQQFDEKRTQGIVIQFSGKLLRKLPDFGGISGNICLVLLDQISDPQNLGQIIRTCECAGVDGLIIPDRRSAGITDTVLQVSQGAFVSQPIYQCGNVHQTILNLKDQGFWAIGVENSIEAKLWYEAEFTDKVIIVLGSEGKGIRPLVLKSCDFFATIPMQGKLNSLNVTAAVSAILFERNRQIESGK